MGFEQWRPDYPTRQTILEDIAQQIGYAFVHEEELIGYCCIMTGEEPAYQAIEGAWKTDRPYAVAVSYTHLDVYKRQVFGCRPSPGPITATSQAAAFSSIAVYSSGSGKAIASSHFMAMTG